MQLRGSGIFITFDDEEAAAGDPVVRVLMANGTTSKFVQLPDGAARQLASEVKSTLSRLMSETKDTWLCLQGNMSNGYVANGVISGRLVNENGKSPKGEECVPLRDDMEGLNYSEESGEHYLLVGNPATGLTAYGPLVDVDLEELRTLPDLQGQLWTLIE